MQTICIAFSCNMSLPMRSIHARILFLLDWNPLITHFKTTILEYQMEILHFLQTIKDTVHVLRWIHLFLLIVALNWKCIMFWSPIEIGPWHFDHVFKARTLLAFGELLLPFSNAFYILLLLSHSLSLSHFYTWSSVENSWKHFRMHFRGVYLMRLFSILDNLVIWALTKFKW